MQNTVLWPENETFFTMYPSLAGVPKLYFWTALEFSQWNDYTEFYNATHVWWSASTIFQMYGCYWG